MLTPLHPFNGLVKRHFLNSPAVKRGKCYRNEMHYETARYLDELVDPISITAVRESGTPGTTNAGPYRSALLNAIIEVESSLQKLVAANTTSNLTVLATIGTPPTPELKLANPSTSFAFTSAEDLERSHDHSPSPVLPSETFNQFLDNHYEVSSDMRYTDAEDAWRSQRAADFNYDFEGTGSFEASYGRNRFNSSVLTLRGKERKIRAKGNRGVEQEPATTRNLSQPTSEEPIPDGMLREPSPFGRTDQFACGNFGCPKYRRLHGWNEAINHHESHLHYSERTYEFVCEECGQGNHTRSAHRLHLSTHTPIAHRTFCYNCTWTSCGFKTNQTCNWNRHWDMHLYGDERIECRFMDMLVASGIKLEKHAVYLIERTDASGETFMSVAYPDSRIREVEDLVIPSVVDVLTEADEHAHRSRVSYPVSEESLRALKLHRHSDARRTVFIRVNMHEYKVDGVKHDPSLEQRVALVHNLLLQIAKEEIAAMEEINRADQERQQMKRRLEENCFLDEDELEVLERAEEVIRSWEKVSLRYCYYSTELGQIKVASDEEFDEEAKALIDGVYV